LISPFSQYSKIMNNLLFSGSSMISFILTTLGWLTFLNMAISLRILRWSADGDRPRLR
jgi:hypothetical protein